MLTTAYYYIEFCAAFSELAGFGLPAPDRCPPAGVDETPRPQSGGVSSAALHPFRWASLGFLCNQVLSFIFEEDSSRLPMADAVLREAQKSEADRVSRPRANMQITSRRWAPPNGNPPQGRKTRRIYRSCALICSIASAPGQSSSSPSELRGTSTVFIRSLRSRVSLSMCRRPVTISPAARRSWR